MSVLIKGMEMPESCAECAIRYEMFCPVVHRFIADDGRRKNCPLVAVPPHGRLIDADAFMLEIQEYIEEYGWETDEHGWHNEKWCAMKEAAMVIENAPTIIPADTAEEAKSNDS